MAMSKVAIDRLMRSEFWREVTDTVAAWDYYLNARDTEASNEMMHKWNIAKLALKHITGKTYGFSRCDGWYGLVNEADESEKLIWAPSLTVKQV